MTISPVLLPHVLQHEESEDTDATPRLTVSSSLRPRMQLDIYWY